MLIKSLVFVALEFMFCYCATYVEYHQKRYSRRKAVLLKILLIILELLIIFGLANVIVKDALHQ